MGLQTLQNIQNAVSSVIIGKEQITKLLLTAWLSGGHVLIEDMPGTGKTLLAKTLAASINAEFKRVQFTPDLLPSDITGLHYYQPNTGSFAFRKGPLFTQLLLADEINRATPRTQSALLECMEEHQVTLDGTTYALPKPFFVIATQNPIETAGTFNLPEAQLDRFTMKLHMGGLTAAEEMSMLTRFETEQPLARLLSVAKAEDIIALQDEVKKQYVHPHLKEYIVSLAQATRANSQISCGVSPRGSLALFRTAQAYAYLSGRNYVVPEDIHTLAVPVLAHRLVVNLSQAYQSNTEAIIKQLLTKISVPTEDWSL